jgi:uncharacterized protein (TIGR02597 family)
MNADFVRRLLNGFICCLSALVFYTAGSEIALAVDACSGPTDSLTTTFLTNSDSFVSVPYIRPPLFCGLVQSASDNTITVQGATSWTTGQWSQINGAGYFPNYVVLTSGAKEGATLVITNNSADTLFMPTNDCDDLNGVSTGDQLAIIPYWTLGTVFPGGAGITPSVSSTAPGRRTQVLIPFRSACAPNCSGVPNWGFYSYFFHDAHWRKVGMSASSNYDDAVMLPDQYLIVRQPTNSPSPFALGGNVVQYTTRTCLYADNFTTNWDNSVANYHSTTQTLDQANLAAAFTASNPGATNPVINDLLLVYDNRVSRINKAPAHVYFYNVDHWADLANPPVTIDCGGDPVFVPGTGVIVRKRPGNITVWVDPP